MKTRMVSVIIPVYNEEKYIEGCLSSLIKQTYPLDSMEWIIVDGNSSDETRAIISRYQQRYPIVLLINKKKKTPISLNLGIQHAKGDYIIRFDAHANFPEDYIENCVRCLETVPADNVGGWIETKAEGLIGLANAKILSSKFGVGGSIFRTARKSGYVDTVPFGAFHKEIFSKIGLFNEELLRSEDNDFNARIRESGGKIYLSENIHSVYYCRDTVGGLLKMGMQNGNALFRTLLYNPKAMSVRHFIPFIFLLSLIILPVLGIFWTPVLFLFFIESACYLLLDFYFSFLQGNKKLGLVTIWLYPLFHLSYGAGSLMGFLGINLY